MKRALSGTCLSDFRLFVRSNIPGLPVHSLLTASHAKQAQTSTVPRWVMTEFQPSGPFATLEPSTAVDPFQTFMPAPGAGQVAQEALIRVRLLVMLADRLMSVRRGVPLRLSG